MVLLNMDIEPLMMHIFFVFMHNLSNTCLHAFSLSALLNKMPGCNDVRFLNNLSKLFKYYLKLNLII